MKIWGCREFECSTLHDGIKLFSKVVNPFHTHKQPKKKSFWSTCSPQPLAFLSFLKFCPLIAHFRTKVLKGVALCSKRPIKGEERFYLTKYVFKEASLPFSPLLGLITSIMCSGCWDTLSQTPWGGPFTLHSAPRTLRGLADAYWVRGLLPGHPEDISLWCEEEAQAH